MHNQQSINAPLEAILDVQWIPRELGVNKTSDQLFEFGVTTSPYGQALWGFTTAGLCHLSLHDICTDPLNIVQARWPGYQYQTHQARAEAALEAVMQPTTSPIKAWVVGTAFQRQVWQGLLQVRAGELISYQQLAERIGKPQAARAVGSALGNNPIAWLIPCHRVVRQNGGFGQYHWGRARKAAMIQAERCWFEKSSDTRESVMA